MGYRYNVFTGELDIVDTSTATGGYIKQIDTDAGSALPVADIINLLGTAAQGISSSAAGNTVTLTISDATETQKGVSELATNAESIAGADTSRTIVPTSLKAKLGTQTANGVCYGAGDTNALAWTAGMANGNLIIGSTAGNPAPAFLTSADGSVIITNGANSIDLTAGAAVPTSFVTDAGTATPALNILDVLGGNNIGTTGVGNDLTINLTGTTDHTVQVGNATGSLTSLAAGTTGELLIANTGADPAFGSTAYADFSFSNVTGVGVPRSLNIANTDVNAASTVDLRLSTPPLGGDSMVSWEVQGTLFYAMGVDNSDSDIWKLTTSSDPSSGTTAIAVDNATAAVKFANAYEFPIADGNANDVMSTDGAGNIDFVAAGSLLTDLDNILYVGKHGSDANNGKTPNNAKLTIQAAVTAAAAGDTIIVYPGTYTETITHSANNLTLIAEGKTNSVIITQADANVIDFATFTGIQYKYFGISCTAATTAINTVQGSTGGCTFKECQLSMTCATDIAAVTQPAVGSLTGAGELKVTVGKVSYAHTGNGGATANKGAFRVANGGTVTLQRINDLDVSCSGTALVTSVGIDTASTGVFKMNDNKMSVTDPNAVIVAGFAYLGGTGTEHEYFRNTLHVTATNNIGYGFFSADTASTTRSFYNHIHVEDTAGSSYSFLIGNTATVISQFDDIVAADGYSLTAGGFYTQVNSEIDGDLTCCGATAAGTRNLTVCNNDNTATASNAALNISVGGTTSTGDPYTKWLITGSTAFSAGIDNSDSDAFKIGPNVDPSTGTSSLEVSSGGAITFAEAYEFPVADGTANFPLVTDGAGNLDFNSLTVAGGGTGATTLTDHSVLVGSGTAAITPIAVGNTGELLVGSSAADPAFSTSADGDFTFTSSTAGATRSLTVTNTESANAASHAKLDIVTGGANGGDPYLHLNTGVTEFSLGIDNSSTTDLLKITNGASPSAGTQFMQMGNSGVKDYISFFDANAPSGTDDGSIFVYDSIAGGNVTVRASNTDNSDTDSNAGFIAIVGGTSGGDPVFQWAIGPAVTLYSMGIDNSDADALKITTGNDPSAGSDLWKMSSAGERIMPLQPAFLAYNSATDANQTGSGATATIDFDTEIFDQNSDFAADTFTAPVTGRYILITNVVMDAVTAAMNTGTMRIVTSNRAYITGAINWGAIRDGANNLSWNLTCLADMDAADTATVTIMIGGAVAETAGVFGTATTETYFSGSLQC